MAYEGEDLFESTVECLLHLDESPDEVKSNPQGFEILDSAYQKYQNDRASIRFSDQETNTLKSWMHEKIDKMETNGFTKEDLETTQYLNWVIRDSGAGNEKKYQVIENMKSFHDGYFLDPRHPELATFPCDYMGKEEIPDAAKYSLTALASIIPKTEEAHQKFQEATNSLENYLLQKDELDQGWDIAINIARETAKARFEDRKFIG